MPSNNFKSIIFLKTCLSYISKAEKISYIPNYFSTSNCLYRMANINVGFHSGEKKK